MWAKANIQIDGVNINPDNFLEYMKTQLSQSITDRKIKDFKTFNAILPDDQKYLDKLRKNYPNRDIPSDIDVSNAISKLKNGKEKVIDDLIIRKEDNSIEFELI